MHRVTLHVRYVQTAEGWVGQATLTYHDEGTQEAGETPAFPTVQALREYLDAMMENFIDSLSQREPVYYERTYGAA